MSEIKERGITISKKVEVIENGKKLIKWIEWNKEWSKKNYR